MLEDILRVVARCTGIVLVIWLIVVLARTVLGELSIDDPAKLFLTMKAGRNIGV